MKTKTDIYTKAVLTVIAIFLGIIVFKDINVVSKAQANELDLSALKIENASDAEGTVYYIYDISSLEVPFGTEEYKDSNMPPYKKWKPAFEILDKKHRKGINEAYFDNDRHYPKYMITNKTGSFWIKK